MRAALGKLLWLAPAICLWAQGALAHEVRPAYLEIRETAPEAYDLVWKVPARGDLRLSLDVVLPAECEMTRPVVRHSPPGAFVDRWSVRCPGGLAGKEIEIRGLSATLTDALVRITHLNGSTQVTRVFPDEPRFEVQVAPGGWQVAGTYFRLGVEHILLGIDHLLFVLALLFVARTRWLLLKTITAFTVAHSITLALATLGFVHVPPAPVEAVIALSIVFVAAEILHARAGHPGITARSPWLVAFLFGLLHGFGFAGALSEIGLPQGHIPLALFFFNVGVEAGQIVFVGAVLGVAFLARPLLVRLPRWVEAAPAYGIGSIAMFWVLERVSGF